MNYVKHSLIVFNLPEKSSRNGPAQLRPAAAVRDLPNPALRVPRGRDAPPAVDSNKGLAEDAKGHDECGLSEGASRWGNSWRLWTVS